MIKKTIVFLCVAVFFLSPFLVLGIASETGKIQGRVVDKSGESLPGVRIEAKSPNLQGVRTTITTQDGDFQFPLLPVGKYTLTFSLEGFNPLIQESVIVRLGRVTSIKATMQISTINEEIVVTATTPLVDTTSTNTSYHITSDDLATIPVQNRTIVDAIKFIPGITGVRANTRRGTSTQGQPSFRGEGEEGNNWIVDGLSISGVRLKNSGMHINYDSLDEIQVISDPFSPEFGSAYGGVINMVTKSGSNKYSGEFSLVFSDKNFQAERMEQLSVVSEPDKFSNYNFYFNLGGPLVKDRLWFFISNNLFADSTQTRDNNIDYLSIPGGRLSMQHNNIFAKLSYAVTNNHNLALTTIFHNSLGQKGGIGIPDLFEEKRFSDIILRLNYKGILNASTLVEAGLGYLRRDSSTEPIDQNLGPAQYFIEDLARSLNNSYGNITDDTKRTDFNLKFTKFIDTKSFGSHEFNLGFEYYSLSSEFAVDFTGQNEDLFPSDGFDSGTRYSFSSWEEGSRTPTYYREYGVFDFINSASGIGVFIKDKIIINRFTFMLGLRSQTQLCLDNNREKLWSWGLLDFFSPRFSLSVDITGDGGNVLKLGFGRFSDIITTMPLGLLNSGAGLTFRMYEWSGPSNPNQGQIEDTANWVFGNEQKTQPFEIASDLKPNFLTRFLIEFDKKIGQNWAIITRYVQTSAKDLLEVLAVLDIAAQDYKFLYDNFEYKRRNYKGLEFELRGRLGDKLHLNASYSLASAKGTNPGQSETGSWSQEEGSTNYMGLFGNHIFIPNTAEFKDLKDQYDLLLGGLGGRGIGDEGWYGKLPYSVDHNVKINAIYFAPYGLILSSAVEWISGYYWEKMGYVPFFDGFYAFPEGRGSRSSPSHFFIDLGIEKEINLGSIGLPQSMALDLRIDILNILNSQRPISYVKEDIPIFGQIWGRQQPRQARILIRMKW
ncbi:carboxypeptidase regulatory-like domain-containing protein [Acidobacteriota bacterium]